MKLIFTARIVKNKFCVTHAVIIFSLNVIDEIVVVTTPIAT